MTTIKHRIKQAIDVAQKAQRNFDLSRTIPMEDIETMIYAAQNSPSKQNETHYALKVYTDPKIIEQVYYETRKFTAHSKDNVLDAYSDEKGEFWQDEKISVYNSQILSNVLFVYTDDEDHIRGGEHKLALNNRAVCGPAFEEQKNYSVGISVGELILTASMLGYKCGVCCGFNRPEVKQIVDSESEVKLLVGIGFENKNLDRQFHGTMYNKDLPPNVRTGEPDERWKFPSFKKHIRTFLNGKLR